MRVALAGVALPEGKWKYTDEHYQSLVDKFQPVKLSPYYFEFRNNDSEAAQAIVVAADGILDLLIPDMEKIESRLSRTADAAETAVLQKCLAHLEEQKPVCDLALEGDERTFVRTFGLVSFKPVVTLATVPGDVNEVCRAVMEKAGMMFFYTVGKPEVHAWLVERNAPAVACAGRIHTDLARGFIKAEIFRYEDILATHSVQDARGKGLVKLVDRDFPVPPNSIIEIRFNV
jgi:ribosome-binding ATPase YchF (GTP1/OBG family)